MRLRCCSNLTASSRYTYRYTAVRLTVGCLILRVTNITNSQPQYYEDTCTMQAGQVQLKAHQAALIETNIIYVSKKASAVNA